MLPTGCMCIPIPWFHAMGSCTKLFRLNYEGVHQETPRDPQSAQRSGIEWQFFLREKMWWRPFTHKSWALTHQDLSSTDLTHIRICPKNWIAHKRCKHKMRKTNHMFLISTTGDKGVFRSFLHTSQINFNSNPPLDLRCTRQHQCIKGTPANVRGRSRLDGWYVQEI